MQFQLDFPLNIDVEINLPSSKSISNRALIISALTPNGILPKNLAQCDDTDVTLAALNSSNEMVDIKAAGTAMRFLTAYYATVPGTKIVTGTERMQNRPIHILVDALKELGADITYQAKEGYPPLIIKGKELIGGVIELDGSVSSQFITALLLVAPTFEQGLTLKLRGDVTSIPYINMTLALMNQAGASAQWEDDHTLKVESQPYQPTEITVEPDWSAASYWFQIVALNPKAKVRLPLLKLNSLQGDAKGALLFKKLGVHFTEDKDGITLTKGIRAIQNLKTSFKEIPDLVQTFVVTAALMGVTFKLSGVETLRIKETDRIEALIQELKKLGYIIEAKGDQNIFWEAKFSKAETNPILKTYDDHRMAMALAPAAIVYPELSIDDPMVVTKSYPLFWEDLQKAGIKVLKK